MTTNSKTARAPKRDLHQTITDRLIAAIEADPGKPQMPWRRSSTPLWMPENALSKNGYNGINVVNLWVAAEARGFTSPVWATYKQWAELGAQVRKGARSELVIFYKEFEVEPAPDADDDDGKRRVARASFVFNAAEVDGFTHPNKPEPLGPIERIEAADRFIRTTQAAIAHGGDRAYYRPSTDTIQMPDEHLFCGTDTMTRDESYYAVVLHELTHWTGAEKRCHRNLEPRFKRDAYAAEELVAEIGSAMLCAELGITQDVRPDHAQYLANWLQILKDDPKAIFTAAAKASEAVSFLKRLQPPA
ncbi:ArdC family protein [Hyphomicrobium sp.]|uniref:ArdC family protein n=1 Tax=Hyphomicrobium sp. TaxID=82 RepID=UPI002E37A923|nr:zincin-like metallopeptidase domain-containing protein [Hyphomicrobium sp.]HEX2839923.1 zincin-like metallopeptidase domain-containing protein [Hyphomicrobium sp.]